MKYDVAEALFSIKCFTAAMLAYYVALSIGLERPYWAVTTAYISSQQLAGAALAKAFFRLIGTVLGAGAAVAIVPSFVNEPLVMSAALATWLALCTAIALLDRTPRAYAFLLAGYTASIIGFPSVDAPGAIFDTAVLRVQEISIGIFASSLLHGLVFPRTVTSHLLDRTDAILSNAERWTCDALGYNSGPDCARKRRLLATELAELDVLVAQLPFDTARLVPRTRSVRAFQDRLLELLPLGGTVESRLAELVDTGGVPPDIKEVVVDTRSWLTTGIHGDAREEAADRLIVRLKAIRTASKTFRWHDMLVLNLSARLEDMVRIHRDARDLADQLRNPSVVLGPHVAMLLAGSHGRSLHRDPGLALRAATGTFVCVMLGCAFWIATAWSDGAFAVLIAGVCCSLFANIDRPAPVIFNYLIGATAGVVAAIAYRFAVNRRPKRTPYRRPKGTPPSSGVTDMMDAPFALLAA